MSTALCGRPAPTTLAQPLDEEAMEIADESGLDTDYVERPLNTRCIVCGELLTGKQQKFCSQRCKRRHYRNIDNPAVTMAEGIAKAVAELPPIPDTDQTSTGETSSVDFSR
jgi:hypothetical protein